MVVSSTDGGEGSPDEAEPEDVNDGPLARPYPLPKFKYGNIPAS